MTFIVYQCVRCGKIFHSKQTIRRHLLEEHGTSELELDYFVSPFKPLKRRWWLFL